MFQERTQAARAELHRQAKNDTTRGDTWPFDHYLFPHSLSVERNNNAAPMSLLLGEGISFQDIVSRRKARGKRTHILELYGSGAFLLQPETADSITGMRLKNIPFDHLYPQLATHVVLEGNLYEPETFDLLTQSMEKRTIPSIDIAVCAPFGPWNHDWDGNYERSVFMDIYYPMLQNTYNLLSTDEGTLYSQVPRHIGLNKKLLDHWARRMNKSGIQTKVVSYKLLDGDEAYAFQITKTENSPQNIIPLLGECLPPSKESQNREWNLLRKPTRVTL